jgi:hypothetical protein
VASLSTSTSTGLSSATSSISSLSTGLSSTDSSVAVDVHVDGPFVGDELDLVAVHLDLHGHQLAVDRPELDR